eukprot:452949-Pleurochrysis_carterae.AAC.1
MRALMLPPLLAALLGSQTNIAAPSAADESADASTTTLDAAANINSAAPGAAAEDAGVSAKTAEVAASVNDTVADNMDTVSAAPEA